MLRALIDTQQVSCRNSEDAAKKNCMFLCTETHSQNIAVAIADTQQLHCL